MVLVFVLRVAPVLALRVIVAFVRLVFRLLRVDVAVLLLVVRVVVVVVVRVVVA